ncbi:MAG: endo-1,4-beta-xylanase [Planctomycetales bacterium]|nr:endo-1,4-beta-xylanase [Planctomycetales bacterium]
MRTLWLVILGFIALHISQASLSTAQEHEADASTPSLKSVVGERFKIGVGVGESVLGDSSCAALIERQFQILTPENCMKPQSIHPAEDTWSFAAPDRFVEFAESRGLEVVGHCLVWAKDDRTDEWMKLGNDGAPVSKEMLLDRIENHIETVVRRYRETATMWDVVNEALADGSEGYLRDSVYSRTAGIEFIETAFRTAREHAPDAILIYNDYNCHFPEKRKKLIRLLTELKERGVPVDAYGMQGHFELGDSSLNQLRDTFDALRELDLKVVVSELDIDVVTRGKWWAEEGKFREELKSYDPYKDGLPTDIEDQQIEQYVALFRLFDEYQDVIERVSFWNLHDGQSWLNYFPWQRKNYPLLFDRELKPKPAYGKVIQLLQREAGHAAHERRDELSRAAHDQLLQKTKQGKIDIYFQGDSITRRWGATDYPQLLEHWNQSFRGWNAANFAWGGDNTHNILWRMQNGELNQVQPKVVVLQAGTNNLPWNGEASRETIDDVVNGIEAIIVEFNKRCPDASIVLTGLFPRDQNPKLRTAIESINERFQSLAMKHNCQFLNINEQLTGSDGKFLPGYSGDGLHLEIPAYDVWADGLKAVFTEILGPPSNTDEAPSPTGIPMKVGR